MVDIVMILLFLGYMVWKIFLNFKQALDEHIQSIYPNINFTIVYDYMIIMKSSFRSYCICRERFFKDKNFSEPADNHEYLDVRSSHQQAVFRSIPRTVASRVRRNCTNNSKFVRAKSEYSNYLLRAGYNISSIDNVFQNLPASMPRNFN